MRAVLSSDFRANMAKMLDAVTNDHNPLTVVRQGGKNVVVVSEDDWRGMEETVYLLSSPKNAERLLRSIAEADAGLAVVRDLIEE